MQGSGHQAGAVITGIKIITSIDISRCHFPPILLQGASDQSGVSCSIDIITQSVKIQVVRVIPIEVKIKSGDLGSNGVWTTNPAHLFHPCLIL